MGPYIQVITTAASEEDAARIAQRLVERRLAACAQVVGPITSTYWWQGRMETSREWQCVLKSRGDLFSAVEAAIREVHAYSTPEILAVPVARGSDDYLAWLDAELGEPPADAAKP
jgi:periplasmic divalent cation tolerance protein